MRVITRSSSRSCESLRRHANGNVNTHCRRATSGSTCSMRLAAVAHMCRPRHDGQNPLPLPTLVARPATKARETSTKQSTVQVSLELFARVLRYLDVERPL